MFLETWHIDILEKLDGLQTAFLAYEICCKKENASHSSVGWKSNTSKYLPMEILICLQTNQEVCMEDKS